MLFPPQVRTAILLTTMAKNENSYILWPLIACCPYQGPIKSVKTTTRVMRISEIHLDEWINQSQKWHLAILQKIQTNRLYHLTYQSNSYNVHGQLKTSANGYIHTIPVKATSLGTARLVIKKTALSMLPKAK
jgi:hypothetical protein